MGTTMEHKLRQALSSRQKRRIAAANRMPAAVLLPLYYKDGDYYLLFTQRTDMVKEHKGQISFPGGTYREEDDTLVNTARRECAEEIGLRADDIEILGELDDTTTLTSSYTISPFVGLIPWPYKLKLDQREVKKIIEIPISVLLDKGCRSEETRVINGEETLAYFYHYQGRVIWGATARILNQFLEIFTRVIGE